MPTLRRGAVATNGVAPTIRMPVANCGRCTGADVYASAPQPFPFLMSLSPVVGMFVALGACHSVAAAAKRVDYCPPEAQCTFAPGMRRLRYPDGLANGTPREKNHVARMLEPARLGLWPASAARLRRERTP